MPIGIGLTILTRPATHRFQVIGHHLAQYRILAELGRGGMGIVYRGLDTKLDRTVALKILPPQALPSELDRARFHREARSAARLSHPHICHVYQVDEAAVTDADGRAVDTAPLLYIAMEYVDGESLAALIERGPLKLEEAIRIALEIASALEAAHGAGVVHRDIKPANVMLTARGEVKVLDFGLAKTSASSQLTRMGSTLGTIAYMSPEQARGEEVDRPTDLWALGIILYEMVCGRRPFAADYEQAALYGILNEDPEPLTARRTGVPMELEAIVAKCLRKDPALRYQTAADLIADLKALAVQRPPSRGGHTTMTGAPSAVGPLPASSSASLPVTEAPVAARRPSAMGMLVLGAIALVAGVLLGVFVLQPDGTPGKVDEIRRYELSASPLIGAGRAHLAPDGRRVAFAGLDTTSGRVAIMSRDLVSGEVTRLALDDMLFSSGFSPDGTWFLYTIPNGVRIVQSAGSRSLTVAQGSFTEASWESDESILYRDAMGELRRAWVDGRATERVVLVDSTQGHVVFSDVKGLPGTGLTVVTVIDNGGKGHAALVDTENGTYEIIQADAWDARYHVSGHLVYRSGPVDGPVVARPFDLGGRRFLGPPTPLGSRYDTSVEESVARDGTAIFAPIIPGRNFRRVSWLDLATGNRSPADLEAADYGSPVVSPDGQRLGVEIYRPGTSIQDVVSIGLDDGMERVIGRFKRQDNPAYSPDGQWVAYDTRLTGEGRSIFVGAADGSGSARKVATPEFEVGEPFFHPDGRRIVYRAVFKDRPDEIRAIAIDGSESQLVARSEQALFDPAVSPDGRLVAAESNRAEGETSNVIVIFEYGGSGQWSIPCEVACYDPQWSDDGRSLFYRDRTRLYRVRLGGGATVALGRPEAVASLAPGFIFALAPGSKRAVVLEHHAYLHPVDVRFQVVVNWLEELKALSPAE